MPEKKRNDDESRFADYVLIISIIFISLVVLFIICAVGFSLFMFAKQKNDTQELERLSVKAKAMENRYWEDR